MAIFSFVAKFDGTAWIKINCLLTLITIALLILNYIEKGIRHYETLPEAAKVLKVKAFSGCCTFPCVNGICMSTEGNDYKCICPSSSYSGKDCEHVKLVERLKRNIWIDNNVYEKYTVWNGNSPFWRYINKWPLLSKYYNKKIYHLQSHVIDDNSLYPSAAQDNLGYVSGRSLASTPLDCPTPMGMKGLLQLPSFDDLWQQVLKRNTFLPCKRGTNFLFVVYIQHFLAQFQNVNNHIVNKGDKYKYPFNMAHIYGDDARSQLALRSFRDGKLKTRILYDEEYPPFISDCPAFQDQHGTSLFRKSQKWAIGLPKLGDNPFLFVMSTIWLREHNRVCDLLANEHRDWTDEQLYETAKFIVTSETIKITLTEYLQHLLQFDLKINYEPELLSNMDIKYGTQVPVEPFLVPTWHMSVPDELIIDNTSYSMNYLVKKGTNIIFTQGLDTIINAMSISSAGEFTSNNVGNHEVNVLRDMIQNGRSIRLQSLNNYRRKFGLEPFKTFYEITENVQLAETLQNLYFDVDALELPIGLVVEKKKATVVPSGMTAMAGSWLIHLLLSHPINSPELQKLDIFGGSIGLNIIKSVSLKKLICLNLSSKCKHVHVDFKIPPELMYKWDQNK